MTTKAASSDGRKVLVRRVEMDCALYHLQGRYFFERMNVRDVGHSMLPSPQPARTVGRRLWVALNSARTVGLTSYNANHIVCSNPVNTQLCDKPPGSDSSIWRVDKVRTYEPSEHSVLQNPRELLTTPRGNSQFYIPQIRRKPRRGSPHRMLRKIPSVDEAKACYPQGSYVQQ